MNLLMILAPGFEELEAIGVADILTRSGVKVTLAGLDDTEVAGAHGFVLKAERLFSSVRPTEYDGVILPGGLPGATNLRASTAVIDFVRALHRAGKIVAAICAAPIVLARAGVLTDGKFTMYPGFDADLNGLHYTDAPAERAGNVVTGKGPGAIFAFAARIAEAAGAGDRMPELYSGMFVRL